MANEMQNLNLNGQPFVVSDPYAVKSVNGTKPDETGNVDTDIKTIVSGDTEPYVNLRDLESGTYILSGKFHAYSGHTGTLSFSSALLVNVIKSTSKSSVQVFYPVSNCVQFLEITDDAMTRTNVYLNKVIEYIGTMTDLTTDDKTSLVGAINELVTKSGAGVSVDDTLTISGSAADAKATGDQIRALSDEIAELGGTLVEPAEDDIPKVFFGGALQQTKDAAVVPFRYISKTQDVSGYAEIKAQGNSSMSYPKKNQTVKMFKDADCTEKMKVDFKGWGAQNKHVYKANWIDLSHARNVVSARIWGDIVKSRANYAELPELYRSSPNHGAVDGFPVKVYAAGVYQGRYTLNIPKDKWMAKMDDTLDTNCILCGEGYLSGCFREASVSQWTDEIHDSMPDAIKNRWIEVINFVMSSTNEEFKANLGNYFDIPSLIDYHIYGLVSCGLDAYGKNQLYFTYDGQKWIAGMYDMDSTWGLYWNGGSFVATDYSRTEYQDFKDGEGNLLYIRLEQGFTEEIKSRWSELKKGAISIENIINRFERFTDIAPAELIEEDYASTTGGGAFTGIPSKTTNNIQQIRNYALARIGYVDEYISALITPIYATGISLDKTSISIEDSNTVTITATVTPENTTETIVWSSSDTDVATVNGGVVTPLGNGSCTITAKVGEYSASCEVTVSSYVPAGVNFVKSISSSGTQYIDTGIVPTADMVYEISLNDTKFTAWESFFGTRNSIFIQQGADPGRIYLYNFGNGANHVVNTIGNDKILCVDCPNKILIVDGETFAEFTLGTNTTTLTLPLFAVYRDNGTIDTYGEFTMYYFTIKDSAGELIIDLKPCLDAGGTPCLYDTVSKKYFYNAGTGDFTYEALSE